MKQINPYEKLNGLPDMLMRPGGFKLTERLVQLASLPKGASILDVGCGVGGSVNFLSNSGYNAAGVDKSSELIKSGRKLYNGLQLAVSQAESIPFDENSFDAVLFECSISLTDVNAALENAKRILKSDGALLISDVFSKTQTEKLGNGMTMLTTSDFSKLLSKHGFKVTAAEDATMALDSFIAQLIMSTGSVDVLFDCCDMDVVKKLKPCYHLFTAVDATEGDL